MSYICQKPTVCTKPRVHPHVNYEPWVMMCTCRFTDHNKCTTVVWNVNNWGGCMGVKMGYMGTLVLSLQFCCKPQSVLKIKCINCF